MKKKQGADPGFSYGGGGGRKRYYMRTGHKMASARRPLFSPAGLSRCYLSPLAPLSILIQGF